MHEETRHPPGQGANRRAGIWLALLLLGTLIKGFGWSWLIFPFDAPDEPSHFNYMLQVRTYQVVPVVVMPTATSLAIPPSTPRDPATLALLQYFSFRQTDFRSMPYESAQPPLFHMTTALLTMPFQPTWLVLLYVGRLIAVLWGVGAVAALWWAVRALWPDRPLLVWGAPLALTLHPQFSFITATITNDAAVLALGAVLLAVWAAGLRAQANGSGRPIWQWGLLAGGVTALGLLAKLTMLATLPATALWLWWLADGPARARLPRLAAGVGGLGVAGAVLAGPWVARNLLVYGEPTGTRAVLGLVHRLALQAEKLPVDGALVPFQADRFVATSFNSFWAAYAWLGLYLPLWAYWALLALVVAAGAGGLRAWWAGRAGPPSTGLARARRRFAWLAAVAGGAALADLLFYNLFVDIQPQGRYLFVALAPLLLVLVLGLRQLTPWHGVHLALGAGLLGLLGGMQLLSIPLLLDHWQLLRWCLDNC